MSIKTYICQYKRYVVVENSKGSFVTRRLYEIGNGKYYYILDNRKHIVAENDLHW